MQTPTSVEGRKRKREKVHSEMAGLPSLPLMEVTGGAEICL